MEPPPNPDQQPSPYPQQPPWQSPQQQPYQYPPQVPPPKKRGIGKFFAIGCGSLVALVILVIVLAAVVSGGHSSSSSTTSATTTQVSASQPTQAPQPTAKPTQAPTLKPTAKPAPTFPKFDDGTFQVGKDIQSGTYRTRVGSPGCYYARLRGFGGTVNDIIANDNTEAPAIVTIAATDKGFMSQNCGTWTKDLSQITQSKSTFGDGMFIIGIDITPGTYRNTGAQGCYYARLSGFGNTTDDIIANNNVDTATIVTIASTDKGFQSKGCGTWTKQ